MGGKEWAKAVSGTVVSLAIELAAAKLSDTYGWSFVWLLGVAGLIPAAIGWWPEIKSFRRGRIIAAALAIVFCVGSFLYWWYTAPDTSSLQGIAITEIARTAALPPGFLPDFVSLQVNPRIDNPGSYFIRPISALFRIAITNKSHDPITFSAYSVQGYDGAWHNLCHINFELGFLATIYPDPTTKASVRFSRIQIDDLNRALDGVQMNSGSTIRAWTAVWCPESNGTCNYKKFRLHLQDSLGTEYYSELKFAPQDPASTSLESGKLKFAAPFNLENSKITVDYACHYTD
jgi:hypothetical protein